MQANSMINAYASQATPWILQSPNYEQTYHQLLDAFVDDTDIFATQQPWQNFLNFMMTLQFNLDLWHNLLQASGGILNPSKCIWLSVTWKISLTSKPTIVPPPTTVQLIMTIHRKPPVPICLLAPHESHHYLGVYLATDTNCKTELNTFRQCSAAYVWLLHTCPFTASDASIIYKQCYLTMVMYPLLDTSMPPEQLYKTQSPATLIFLTEIGFPHTFLCMAVYASPDLGGIGFFHLGHKQGLQKCLQLVKHICAQAGIRHGIQHCHPRLPALIRFA